MRGEPTYYNDLSVSKPIEKRGKGVKRLSLHEKELGVPLNPKKVNDVKPYHANTMACIGVIYQSYLFTIIFFLMETLKILKMIVAKTLIWMCQWMTKFSFMKATFCYVINFCIKNCNYCLYNFYNNISRLSFLWCIYFL